MTDYLVDPLDDTSPDTDPPARMAPGDDLPVDVPNGDVNADGTEDPA